MADSGLRVGWLDSILAQPAPTLEAAYRVHAPIIAGDWPFYAQLAAWYLSRGPALAHRQAFVVRLVLGSVAQRQLGLALLHGLTVAELAGAVDFLHGSTRRQLIAASTKPRLLGRLLGWQHARQTVEAKSGLFRGTPRSLRTEITRYLRRREADPAAFDAVALSSGKQLKRLYALHHIKPSPRTQQILFDRRPPTEGPLHARRELSHLSRPCDQVKAIVDLAIPYRVAVSALRHLTPTVLLALVEQMSPDDVLDNLTCLTRRGVMDNAYLKARVERKLRQAPPAPKPSQCGAAQVLAEILCQALPSRHNASGAGG